LVGGGKTVALEAVARWLTGGWQTKVEAHKTAQSSEPYERFQTIRDRAD
jgi:predicted RecB family nuclease